MYIGVKAMMYTYTYFHMCTGVEDIYVYIHVLTYVEHMMYILYISYQRLFCIAMNGAFISV